MPNKWSPIGRACAAFTLVFAGGACTASVQTAQPVAEVETEDAVQVQSAPVNVTVYPHREYHGHTVYYTEGRWYYPSGGHWYYYRTEPPELARHRAYIQQAPPAPRAYTPQAPPAYAPPPGEAVRVQ